MSVPTKVVKTKLFIGNLDPATQAGKLGQQELHRCSIELVSTSEELTELFSAYGAVLEASVIKDYGFVVRRDFSGTPAHDHFVLISILEASKKQRKQQLP